MKANSSAAAAEKAQAALVRKTRRNNLCLLVEDANFRDTRFYSGVIVGIQDAARQRGYDILIQVIRTEKEIPLCLRQGRTQGVILLGGTSDDYLHAILSFHIPLICVDYASLAIATDAVLTQNITGMCNATRHLIENGHETIGFFGERYFSQSFHERWLGYCEAMRQSGLPVDPGFCIFDHVEQSARHSQIDRVCEQLRGMRAYPTAWVCANDSAAVVLINALQALGRQVPQDASLVGFDDIDLSQMIHPSLTTMRVERKWMGLFAVRTLLERMQSPDEPTRQIRLPVQLIVRESVRALKTQ